MIFKEDVSSEIEDDAVGMINNSKDSGEQPHLN